MIMKEIEREKVGLTGNERSLVEKEKTKMRERRRRSITTNIFHGLRKHGGYRLSARADINEVLRHLAREAGWIVEPDGTTYRSSSATTMSHVTNLCPMCGGSKSTTPTPTSSCLAGGGECSTTASPRRTTAVDSAANIQSSDGGGPVSIPSAVSSCQYDVALMNDMQQNSRP